jgi:hypothetical protein
MTATETQVDTDSGYYELFIPLWDGDSRPVHGTIGVYGDEDALRDVSPGLVDSIHDYCGETEPSNRSTLNTTLVRTSSNYTNVDCYGTAIATISGSTARTNW